MFKDMPMVSILNEIYIVRKQKDINKSSLNFTSLLGCVCLFFKRGKLHFCSRQRSITTLLIIFFVPYSLLQIRHLAELCIWFSCIRKNFSSFLVFISARIAQVLINMPERGWYIILFVWKIMGSKREPSCTTYYRFFFLSLCLNILPHWLSQNNFTFMNDSSFQTVTNEIFYLILGASLIKRFEDHC